MNELKVTVDGAEIHYVRSGVGPPLLVVHGLVGSASNWDKNIDSWAQIRTVYALDQVNMGLSQRVAGLDAGLEASADRIAAFMDALGIAAADMAGHSHGGAVVMMFAMRYPACVRRLVLFAPANPFCGLRNHMVWFFASAPGRGFARLIPKMPRLVHDLAHRRMYCDQSKVTRRALDGYSHGLNPDSMEHILGIVAAWHQDMAKLKSGLSTLKELRTLLVWGDRDRAVGVDSGRRLAQAIDAELVIISNTGHLPFQEKPEECNETVLQWLSRDDQLKN